MVDWVDYKRIASELQVKEEDLKAFIKKGENLPPTQEIEDNLSTNPPVKPVFSENDVTIYHDNFITSSALEHETIDLIVTSPPYNLGIDYSNHDDTDEYDDYLWFTEQWLTKAYQVSRSDGRLCMNIPLDKNKGGQQSVGADITKIAKDVGWQYHSTIIWNEGNISRRTAWGSWMSASAPYVIAPVEIIVVMYKENWKKTSGSRENDITRDEFMAWTNGVWTFNGESKKRIGHPAPFPRELPKRCIKLFSFVGATVLDPFLGSGTTLIEAWDNKRVGIGFDLSEEYCQLAEKRLTDTWLKPKLI
ncbi:MAG: site-specific DNA-methyltransferase [Anaerolineae bacterium]|nr:site-specific DNA-methyltransferase [Anaerolineae bacterium]MDQ7036260.1 site-specific DNA-methyltransferase [Anaerolineae bacterium]